jgi:hypothetical protein
LGGCEGDGSCQEEGGEVHGGLVGGEKLIE